MPLYEFECEQCKRRCALLVRSAGEQCVCPLCGSAGLRKLVSGFAFTSRDSTGAVTARSGGGCCGCSSGDCAHCSH